MDLNKIIEKDVLFKQYLVLSYINYVSNNNNKKKCKKKKRRTWSRQRGGEQNLVEDAASAKAPRWELAKIKTESQWWRCS